MATRKGGISPIAQRPKHVPYQGASPVPGRGAGMTSLDSRQPGGTRRVQGLPVVQTRARLRAHSVSEGQFNTCRNEDTQSASRATFSSVFTEQRPRKEAAQAPTVRRVERSKVQRPMDRGARALDLEDDTGLVWRRIDSGGERPAGQARLCPDWPRC